jgi:hypothetical protein
MALLPVDFDRFLDVDNIQVVSKHGLIFSLTFYKRKCKQTDNKGETDDEEDEDVDSAELTGTLYVIECYTKEYAYDRDCICRRSTDDELYEGCTDDACNWTHEIKVVDKTSAACCLTKLVKSINSVVYCSTCSRAHVNDGSNEKSTCASCFLQRLINNDMCNIGNCPVCMEDFTQVMEKRLECCSNSMCRKCFRSLKEPKACPFCRCVQ